MTETKILDRVRALLAKAESTEFPEEAETLTAKAAELMAKYGIEQALLDATRKPEDNKPVDKKFTLPDPYARVKGNFLYGLGKAMGCTGVQLSGRTGGIVMHMFGFRSDIERMEVLFTSLLLQMAHGLARTEVPSHARTHVKAWRRSWMLGFVSATVARVKQAENLARNEAEEVADDTPGAALVLADRSLQVQGAFKTAYPNTRTVRTTYSGSGYGAGYRSGQAANLGGTSVGRRSAGVLRG